MVLTISHALSEQTSAVNEIARSMEQVSLMAESSSLATDASMRETGNLNEVAQALTSSVVRFQLA